MDVVEFLNSKETYEKVVKLLSEKTGVPIINPATEIKSESIEKGIEGFIAGGSVANILNSMVYGGEPVINDIDIFYLFESEDGWVESDMDDFPLALGSELVVDGDWYGNKWVQTSGDFCLMKSQFRQGVINYVEVHVGSRKETYDKNMVILKGFDINSCQVGIDLFEEKIVFTKEFVEFLKTRQMLVTIPVNPIQTAIRLIKKVKDLNCYCDLENEFKILQYACFCDKISRRFGSETYGKYLIYKEEIDKIFNIVKLTNKGGESNLYPGLYISGKELWSFEPKLDSYEIKYGFSHPLELINWWRINEKVVSKSKKRKLQKIIDFLYKNGVESYEERHDFRNLVKNRKSVGARKLSSMLGVRFQTYKEQGLDVYDKLKDTDIHSINHWLWSHLLTNKDYHDCDFSVKHLKYLDDFFFEHKNLHTRIFTNSYGEVKTTLPMTIQKQYELVKKIKSIANKRGDWIIGELENLPYGSRKKFFECDNKIKFIDEYMDEVEVELSKRLVEPISLDGFEYEGCVKELTSKLELRNEGKMMGHCVGGYGGSIERGYSRIFHIDCDGIGSTLEVGIGSGGWPNVSLSEPRQIPQSWLEHGREELNRIRTLDVRIDNAKFANRQHYGRLPEKGNLKPTETNLNIANKLVEFLNQTHSSDILKDLLLERHKLELIIRERVDMKELESRQNNPNEILVF